MDTRGAPFSHAADLILKEVGREEGFESRNFVRLQNLLLNEGDNHPWIIPQPYRDRFIALYNQEAAQSGSDEPIFPLAPFPQGESYDEEARRLYDQAAARNIPPLQVARKAGVSLARVMAFYRDTPLTPAVRSKIIQAHADLGV
jgi:hypothetical protein